MHKSVYLDNNATTPLDPRVFNAMKPYFELYFGNPSSQLHEKGWEAKTAVEMAREKVARLLHAQPQEITFTSGSTESNNWALKGLIESLREEKPQEPLHVLTSNIEHASVKEPLLYLQKKGVIEVDFVPVDSEGFLTVETLEKFRRPTTRLISVIWVHNEIGTIQNLEEIAQWAETHGLHLHTDATQAVGKIEVNLQSVPVSFLSFSAHKLHGPKGIGVLYSRESKPKIQLRPLLHGGGQEKAGRSGTLNVPAIVGLGEACALAQQEMIGDWERIQILMGSFWDRLRNEFPWIKLNGPSLKSRNSNYGRTPYNLNITLSGVEGFNFLSQIKDLCVSGGSACSSGTIQGNPILMALGHNSKGPSVTLRISASRLNEPEDFEVAFSTLSKALKSLGLCGHERGSQGLTTMLK